MTDFRKRRRVSFATSGVSRVDQSQRVHTDINTIVQRAQRTGQWPNPSTRQPVYGDFTNAPSSLLEAYERVQQADQAFMALPAQIRAEMHNDPVNMEKWLADPANKEDAIKYGLFNPPPKPPQEPAMPPAAEGEDRQPGEAPKPPQGASKKAKPSHRPQESE